MTRTKEAELISALYIYAARCWAEGDLPALRAMGFGREEVDALLSLTLTDIQRLCSVHGHPLKVELDAGTFRLIIEHLRRERRKEETLRALIAADAPLPMMQSLFGLNGKEYTGWRKLLAMPPSAGRPPDADEEASHRAWHAWRALLGDRDPEDIDPAELLELHERTGVPMRSLWNLVQRWSMRGGPGSVGSDPAEEPASGIAASAREPDRLETHSREHVR